jgi:molybdenum cofactor cytidylyltransferase
VTVAAVVLAAGGSRRLGRPKQLLPFRGAPLLDAVLRTARTAAFDQVLVTLGGAADDVLGEVDLTGLDVVVNEDFGTGCGSSVAAALRQVRDDAEGLVLLLGDQPGVTVDAVQALRDRAVSSSVGVCGYDDGPGHPLWFHRRMFDTLAALHGDKAVWKVIENSADVVRVQVPGPVPLDVDTWADYQALLAQEQHGARA